MRSVTNPNRLRQRALGVNLLASPLKLTSLRPPGHIVGSSTFRDRSAKYSHLRISTQVRSFTALWMGTTTCMSNGLGFFRPARGCACGTGHSGAISGVEVDGDE